MVHRPGQGIPRSAGSPPRGARSPELRPAAWPGVAMPFGITTGTDGQVWFTDRDGAAAAATARRGAGDRVGAGTPRRCATRCVRVGQPLGIAAGTGGEVWVADSAGALGQVSPGGQITERTRILRPEAPVAVGAGPDGAMAVHRRGRDARRRARHRRRRHPRVLRRRPRVGCSPAAITPVADGRLQFTRRGRSARRDRRRRRQQLRSAQRPRPTSPARPGLCARPLVAGMPR